MAEASVALFRDSDLINSGKGLLIADESFDLSGVSARENIIYITNRKDIDDQLQKIGFNGNLSDFVLEDAPDNHFDFILFRLNKSKVLTNYLLEQASRILKVGGSLVLTGNNQEGVKSVIKHAEKLGEMAELELLGKGLRYARIVKRADCKVELKGDEYRELFMIEDSAQELAFVSKPGIYGYKKIDDGSRFLADTLNNDQFALEGKVLDLGCGFGYLAASVGKNPKIESLVATDCNVAAVQLCDHNLKEIGIEAFVTLDDCGSELEDRSFDRIICNPPFHQGFGTSKELTVKFVENTKRLLRRRGVAYFVVNKFLAVEEVCYAQYVKSTEIASNHHFKILKLERVK